MTKQLLLSLLFFLGISSLHAQHNPSLAISIEEEAFPGFPPIHSFVCGEYDGKWVILGGRIDGLHRRQPFAAFDPEGKSLSIYVVDIHTKKVWSASTEGLTGVVKEQMQTSNMQAAQNGEYLYMVGGYGYSPKVDEHITYAFLTEAHLPGLIKAIVEGTPIAPHFKTVEDERVRVTGGYFHRLGDTYYLAGGQNFEGRYNPIGPKFGPGFFQQYTNAIKRFKINNAGGQLAIEQYSEEVDTANLHRRDYNLCHQIFPDGRKGFTMFSGVFQYGVDLPWLNTVDVFEKEYVVNNHFNQLLNQYHTANATLYSTAQNRMSTVFFGGISQYFFDENGDLMENKDVPFVKTISMVTRFQNGTMEEFEMGTMPEFLGTSAHFFPVEKTPMLDNGIIDIDRIPQQKTLIGYIAGGIKSDQPNTLFTTEGEATFASAKVFKVYLENLLPAPGMSGTDYFKPELNPQGPNATLEVKLQVPQAEELDLCISSLNGEVYYQQRKQIEQGAQKLSFPIGGLKQGEYLFSVGGKRFGATKSFVK